MVLRDPFEVWASWWSFWRFGRKGEKLWGGGGGGDGDGLKVESCLMKAL